MSSRACFFFFLRLFFPSSCSKKAQAVAPSPPEQLTSFGGLQPAVWRCTAVSCSVIVSIFSGVLDNNASRRCYFFLPCFSFFFLPFLSQQVGLHSKIFRQPSQMQETQNMSASSKARAKAFYFFHCRRLLKRSKRCFGVFSSLFENDLYCGCSAGTQIILENVLKA